MTNEKPLLHGRGFLRLVQLPYQLAYCQVPAANLLLFVVKRQQGIGLLAYAVCVELEGSQSVFVLGAAGHGLDSCEQA
jgi:hypothetical protein